VKILPPPQSSHSFFSFPVLANTTAPAIFAFASSAAVRANTATLADFATVPSFYHASKLNSPRILGICFFVCRVCTYQE
jgi:hypothetical protein